MRKIITIICLGSFYLLSAQYFENEIIFDTEFLSSAKRTLEDHNQNIIIAGYSKDTTFQYSGFLLKVIPGFDTTSILIQNDTADILFTDMLITPDNNYFIVGGIGHDTGFNRQLDHIAVYIFDENLNMLVEKSYKMPEGYNYPKLFILQNKDGNIYAAGGESANSTKLLLLKFDQNGDTLKVNYPYLNNSYIFNVLPKADSISGFYAFGIGMNSGVMVRMEVDNNLIYNIEEMDVGLLNPHSFMHDATARWDNDSMFIFSSLIQTDTIGTPYPFEDLVLIKIKENLEPTDELITVGIQGTRDHGPPYNIDWKYPNKMYVGTFDAYPLLNQWRYFIAMFNENLEVLGSKIISGGAEIDYALWNICATSDGGLICSGAARKQGSLDYDWDVFVHKFMPEDIVTVSEKTENPYDSDYYVYPNPGENFINILTARKGVTVKIYNQSGELVLNEDIENSFKNIIDVSILIRGIYILNFTDQNGFTESIKWIKN